MEYGGDTAMGNLIQEDFVPSRTSVCTLRNRFRNFRGPSFVTSSSSNPSLKSVHHRSRFGGACKRLLILMSHDIMIRVRSPHSNWELQGTVRNEFGRFRLPDVGEGHRTSTAVNHGITLLFSLVELSYPRDGDAPLNSSGSIIYL